MNWDERFRQLEMGEKVLATDECYDNGKWTPAQGYVGKPAPNPRFNAHCVFRRLIDHPPTAEPKCERCGATLTMYDSLDTVRDCPCPPTTEPAQSEGPCEDCGHGKHAHSDHRCYSAGSVTQEECLCSQYHPPIPSPESVEDAKALLPCPFCGGEVDLTHDIRGGSVIKCLNDDDCYIQPSAFVDAEVILHNPDDQRDGFYHSFEKSDAAVIQVWNTRDSKHLERQTPAIIERFVEEVEKHDLFERGYAKLAMQTVKARRSGGEE